MRMDLLAPHLTDAASTLTLSAGDLPGATITGGPGDDTLTLTGGGTFDLTLPAIVTGIATVQGSAAHDTFILDEARFAAISAFDGGPGAGTTWNELVLTGSAFDLTGKTFIGISRIALASDGAVLTVTGTDAAAKALALRTGGLASQHDTLRATGLTFAADEIALLHRQGIDTLLDAAGSHTNAAPLITGLNAALRAVAGARVFVDAGRAATLTDDDPSLSLLVVEAPAGPDAPGRLGLDVSDAVTLSGPLAPGSLVSVDGFEIGMVWDAGPAGLRVGLGPNATPARVSDLLHALTYTFADVLPTADTLPALTITLADEGGRRSLADVAITGLAAAQSAHLTLSHARVSEGARAGTVVGLLSALAAGEADGFSYTLVSDAGHRFALDGERLVVADGARLDFESERAHSVTVRAVKGGVSLEERFVIAIEDEAEESGGTGGGGGGGSGGAGGTDGGGATGTPDRGLVLVGGAGRDALTGADGNDRISGRGGADVLRGAEGADVFVFDTRPAKRAADRLPDFDPRDDTIYLDHRVIKGLGAAGTPEHPAGLARKAFWKGHAAHDASDRIVYDPHTGKLSYDPDGTGARAAITLAVLPKGLKALTHHDVFVI